MSVSQIEQRVRTAYPDHVVIGIEAMYQQRKGYAYSLLIVHGNSSVTITKGFPDYLLVKGDTVKWVEAKTPNDYLSDTQKIVFSILCLKHQTIEVWTQYGGYGFTPISDDIGQLISMYKRL